MRKAGLILKAFADGADSKNAYVVVRSPEDVLPAYWESNTGDIGNNDHNEEFHGIFPETSWFMV